MKIKKPDVTWVCDLDCEKTTPLELAEKFARFINEKDGDDLLSTHNPREFMRAAERGLVQSGEESAGSTSSRVGLESE